MLTRDLLRYRIAAGNAKPSFIETRDPSHLNFASQLIAVYTDGCGSKRMDVEAAAAQIVNAKRDLKLARGLQKILEDRCEYSSCSDYDYPALRQALFARSAELFKNSELPEDISVYHDKVMEREEILSNGIYADLPENERLTGIKKIFPSELLERYNTSLVQSLLLFSSELEAEIVEEDPAELRRLFKYLKFFRLLCTAEAVADKKNKKQPQVIRLKIDGPASILENSLKYGLQLASFFPALCRLKKWKISSAIKVRERNLKLKLDETSGLKCHYTNFGAYIPEEIKMFQSCFNQMETTWQIIDRAPYIKAEENRLIFPDFSFRNTATGQELDLELFHQWHAGQITERLDYLAKHPEIELLIGVDRACVKGDEELQERIKKTEGCFLFSKFPGVENVRKQLDKWKMRELDKPPSWMM